VYLDFVEALGLDSGEEDAEEGGLVADDGGQGGPHRHQVLDHLNKRREGGREGGRGENVSDKELEYQTERHPVTTLYAILLSLSLSLPPLTCKV